MMTNKPFHPARQRGVSLIVTLMIVVLLSLLGLYGAGVLVLDTRSAANDFRAREAMAAAESGTEQGLSFLNANRGRILAGGFDSDGVAVAGVLTAEISWEPCGTEDWCLPIRSTDRANWQYLTIGLNSQPDAGSFDLYVLTPINGKESRLVYNIVAIGNSADGTSTATLKQGAYFYPLLLGSVSTPLAAASNVPLSGNYSIITNSNGGGSGVPVTAWSGSTFTPGGSFASCHIGDFEGGACPSSDALSKNGVTGPDLVGNDPKFPPDLFEYLFGVPAAEYQTIKDEAKVVANCDNLSGASSGLIWVEGSCNLPNKNVGTPENPVMLVVEGGIQATGTYDFYGMVYLFNLAGGTPTTLFNGNYHIHGALFVHNTMTLTLNGSFVLEYDSEVLENIQSNPSSRALARIPGTWSDVQ